jgi:hypothetical protein
VLHLNAADGVPAVLASEKFMRLNDGLLYSSFQASVLPTLSLVFSSGGHVSVSCCGLRACVHGVGARPIPLPWRRWPIIEPPLVVLIFPFALGLIGPSSGQAVWLGVDDLTRSCARVAGCPLLGVGHGGGVGGAPGPRAGQGRARRLLRRRLRGADEKQGRQEGAGGEQPRPARGGSILRHPRRSVPEGPQHLNVSRGG